MPPLLPLIHRGLRLSESEVGLLTGLPTLLFATMSVAGSLLIARVGARRAMLAGLVAVAVAGALRGAGPSVPILFAATVVMGVGVAVIQPGFPSLVKDWFPDRIALATSAYANGMLVGETLPPLLAVGVILPLLGGSWELALAVWSAPVLVAAALFLVAVRHRPEAAGEAAARWWPDWRSAQTWQLGLILGAASAVYWVMNALIPDYLDHSGRAALVPAALGALNATQLLASLIVALRPGLVGHRAPFPVTAIAMASGVAGFLLLPGVLAVIAAGLVGLVSAVVFILALSLPPHLAEPNDVHRLSAAMFTIMYSCSFLGTVLGGLAWDATGAPISAFGPALVATAIMFVMAMRLRLPAGGPLVSTGGAP